MPYRKCEAKYTAAYPAPSPSPHCHKGKDCQCPLPGEGIDDDKQPPCITKRIPYEQKGKGPEKRPIQAPAPEKTESSSSSKVPSTSSTPAPSKRVSSEKKKEKSDSYDGSPDRISSEDEPEPPRLPEVPVLRRSGRITKVPAKPGNVYGEQKHPVDRKSVV